MLCAAVNVEVSEASDDDDGDDDADRCNSTEEDRRSEFVHITLLPLFLCINVFYANTFYLWCLTIP